MIQFDNGWVNYQLVIFAKILKRFTAVCYFVLVPTPVEMRTRPKPLEISPGIPFIWVFPKIGVPQNGWFIGENLFRIDDLG